MSKIAHWLEVLLLYTMLVFSNLKVTTVPFEQHDGKASKPTALHVLGSNAFVSYFSEGQWIIMNSRVSYPNDFSVCSKNSYRTAESRQYNVNV